MYIQSTSFERPCPPAAVVTSLTSSGGLLPFGEPLDIHAQKVERVDHVHVGTRDVEIGVLQGIHAGLQLSAELGEFLYRC